MKLLVLIFKKSLPLFLLLFCFCLDATAGMRDKPPEIIDAIIVGDRAVDIAWHLGVLPKAMAVRGSSWSAAKELKMASQIIGCPNRITVKAKDALPAAIKEYGVTRVIIERSSSFCLYKPQVNLELAAGLVEGLGVKVEYVDFDDGIEAAILHLGKLLGKEEESFVLKEKYQQSLAKVEKKLPKADSDKKVVVFSGVMQQGTGKGFLRVEAPGFYSDRMFLERLKMKNVGAAVIGDKKIDKGHVTLRHLKSLLIAQPDVIVLTGDSLPFQQALATGLKKYPELAEVPAIRNREIYSLPQNIGSSVIDYPNHLLVWARTLAAVK